MAVEYTLHPGQLVWARDVDPEIPNAGFDRTRLVRILHLYQRGDNAGMARVRPVIWSPEQQRPRAFLRAIAELRELTPDELQSAKKRIAK